MTIRRVLICLLMAGMLVSGAACGKAVTEPLSSPLPITSVLVSPIAPAPAVSAPVFKIAGPLYVGDTDVSGTGPAGVPIVLVDVTDVGAELARTAVDGDGNFHFTLTDPLPEGHSIGLQIGDLSGTSYSYEEFTRSDTYYDRPLIGILLDIASVERPPQ